MNLNFDDNSFWEVSLNFKWPHEGFMIGWHIIPDNKEYTYTTVHLMLGFVTVIIEFGTAD